MAQHHVDSDYSENLSDSTTCSCVTSSIDKGPFFTPASPTMFQEPFFLHPPGSRPRDGIYINPMTPYIGDPPKPKDSESFYLHSPHDLVYTRITHLFGDAAPRRGDRIERKDETLTVKVDVHMNNGNYKSINNGNPIRSDLIKDTEHAYEQICLHQAETDSVTSSHKKLSDNISDSSNSRKTDRRYSRSSSVSETSSKMSSEINCYSSTTSTPSLSRNSSSEQIHKSKHAEEFTDGKESTSSQGESEKDAKILNGGPSFVQPPPPPPLPPPDMDEIVVINSKFSEINVRQERRNTIDGTLGFTNGTDNFSATNKSDVSSEQTEVSPASAPVEIEEIKPCQVSHLVNKHMVLPFIPPKFTDAPDSNTLLKPSEYLKSICKGTGKNSLSKARSVDNLDIQGRQSDEEREEPSEAQNRAPGPPPPPLPPLQKNRDDQGQVVPETEKKRPHQPLATISIQDLTSVQLRRTNTKMHATKTFSAPPPRSVSMTNVSEPFFVQKTDLIAELKMSKDITGIKKLKVERAQVEKSQEQNLISEIHKTYSASKFVDQIPEKDSAGNVIPIWKRQMLARKAAERAKKEVEEQIARENEEKRLKSIPPWKRQLLAKKDGDDKKQPVTQHNSTPSLPKIEITTHAPEAPAVAVVRTNEDKTELERQEKRSDSNDLSSENGPIIPWRAQLRKTNSKLNIID